MAIDYVSSETAKLTTSSGSIELLWGDRVRTTGNTKPGKTEVKARGITGWVSNSALGGESLLEVYFIDVGQGDGVLIRTPNHEHVMIDGGYNRQKQPTRKNSADFVDWKFHRDYGKNTIELDAMIASHCDADHYGGLWDLLNPDETWELDAKTVKVDQFFHAGVSWWKKPGGGRWLGPASGGYLTQLLGNRTAARKALGGTGPQLQGEWAKFMQTVVDHGCPIRRLSHVDGYVPGFEPSGSKPTIKVLAPVEYAQSGKAAVPNFGSDSKNTNGHSLLLRLDYGRARILLTGDLNTKAMHHLLEAYAGERMEFQCDVAKGCHHGSDDVSYEFLQAMGAAATVISSGDNEGHAHPRPNIVSASAITGHVNIENDELLTPLIYSTEISRSVSFGRAEAVIPDGWVDESGKALELTEMAKTKVRYKTRKAGELSDKTKTRKLSRTPVVDGIVYGLVNVRTDGNKILCATLNEKKNEWEYQTFESRF